MDCLIFPVLTHNSDQDRVVKLNLTTDDVVYTPYRRESGPDALAYRFKLGSEEPFYLLRFF